MAYHPEETGYIAGSALEKHGANHCIKSIQELTKHFILNINVPISKEARREKTMKKMLWKILIVSLSLVFVSAIGFAAEKASPVPAEVKTMEKKAETAVKAELLDINTASKETLTKLPGIGDAYAKKIIDGRPYANKDQLKSKNIIPANVYEKIKDKIIAKRPPKKK